MNDSSFEQFLVFKGRHHWFVVMSDTNHNSIENFVKNVVMFQIFDCELPFAAQVVVIVGLTSDDLVLHF